MFKDYYKILEVSRSASVDEIKVAYRSLARRWHPDRNSGRDATRHMQALNEAYLILGNTVRRTRYDAEFDRFMGWKSSVEAQVDLGSPAGSSARPQPAPRAVYQDYSVHDDVLRDWINDAVGKAQSLGQQAVDDVSGMLAEAGRSAMQCAVGAIIMFALMYLLLLIGIGG